MIDFVTWPPFSHLNVIKGGQVTKPIILVKIYAINYCTYVIQGVESFGKVTSWPQSFWLHMLVNNVASD